ncbi:MAG: hypothetical protein ACRD1T_02975, partial [Acidimicrobiia bacterium]
MPRLRVITVFSVVLTMLVLPFLATANHVAPLKDALDCALSAAPGFVETDPEQQDRGATCVSDGNPANGPEHYVGGEVQAEFEHPDAVPGSTPVDSPACGAVVEGGRVLAGTRPDDPATAANEAYD